MTRTLAVSLLVLGLLALTLRGRRRGMTWGTTLGVVLAVGASFSVLQLAAPGGRFVPALAFSLLGALAWLSVAALPRIDDRLVIAMRVTVSLAIALLEPRALPVVLALAGERHVDRLPSSVVRVLPLAAAGLLLFLAWLSGGPLSTRAVGAMHDAWLTQLADLRHEQASLEGAIAILCTLALFTLGITKRGELWLLALVCELACLAVFPAGEQALFSVPVVFALLLTQRPPDGAARPARSEPRKTAWAAAVALLVANGVIPLAAKDRALFASAARAHTTFKPSDVLLFAERPSFELTLYAELPSVAFSDARRRAPDQPPIEILGKEHWAAHLRGARLWAEVDTEGQPRFADASDAWSRIVWGVTVASAGSRLREVRGLTSSVPCRAPAIATRTPGRQASASAYLEPGPVRRYAPERAFDGDATTEWLAPVIPMPWLDLTLSKPRTVAGVRLLGAQNLPYRDFEPRGVRVELYRRATLARATDASLTAGQARDVVIRGDDIDCVRLLILSYRGRGGGLAEVELR